ncbi:hypothetical protein BD626DRAFT_563974 [Schizophyllum amplum]|uniref:Uncharacterized protein n=1 Tax=Schizophyllum amplum TaxID=97359 RepID=A0A550CZU9_9AGAR|nr:hypothetical protein BD626DRAFT_563974 [Auriculariopsis ampla]
MPAVRDTCGAHVDQGRRRLAQPLSCFPSLPIMPKSNNSTRGKVSTSKGTRKGKPKKKTAEDDGGIGISISELNAAREETKGKHGGAARTTGQYDGQIVRARAFLKALVKKIRAGEMDTEGLDVDRLDGALEGPPNELSSRAIELFLTKKCIDEGCRHQTAESIAAAFCRYYDNLDGTKYAGEYKYNSGSKEVLGCPARASHVKAFITMIKNRDNAKGASATRNHAEAMTLEDLTVIMRRSEEQWPSYLVNDPDTVEDSGSMYELMKHVMMRAFMSSAFTMWTR